MTTPAPSQVTLWSPHARVGRISSTEDTSLGATYSDGGGMATSRRQIYNQDFARGPLCEDFKFFLSKLPKSLTHADIRKHFETFGHVTYVKLIANTTKNGMRYGFLYMADSVGASAVESYFGHGKYTTFQGHRIFVAKSDPRRERPLTRTRSHDEDKVVLPRQEVPLQSFAGWTRSSQSDMRQQYHRSVAYTSFPSDEGWDVSPAAFMTKTNPPHFPVPTANKGMGMPFTPTTTPGLEYYPAAVEMQMLYPFVPMYSMGYATNVYPPQPSQHSPHVRGVAHKTKKRVRRPGKD